MKQFRFAIAVLSGASQVEAARVAGYAGGNRRQLAVQGCINMKHEQIRKMINETLDGMAQHALARLAEGLDATKTKSCVTKHGILKGDPEVDQSNRLRSVEIWDRLRQRSGGGAGDEVANPSSDSDRAKLRKEVVAMTPVDRALLREAGEIEKELTKVEGRLANDEENNASGEEGQN